MAQKLVLKKPNWRDWTEAGGEKECKGGFVVLDVYIILYGIKMVYQYSTRFWRTLPKRAQDSKHCYSLGGAGYVDGLGVWRRQRQ